MISARWTTIVNGLDLIRLRLVPPAVVTIPAGVDYRNVLALLNHFVLIVERNMIYRLTTPLQLGKESIKVYRYGLQMWMLFAVPATESVVQPVVQEKTGDLSRVQSYAFGPFTGVLDPGGVPLTCTNGDPAPVNSPHITSYGAMHSMHSYWGTMELMVMM